jgi:hypothetical protein
MQKIGTITGFCGEMDAARCYGNPVYIGYLVYNNFQDFFGGQEGLELRRWR